MNCKKGDMARVVADAPMDMRGKIVGPLEHSRYTFFRNRPEVLWELDRPLKTLCTCGKYHAWERIPDMWLRPLPPLPPEDVVDTVKELEHV